MTDMAVVRHSFRALFKKRTRRTLRVSAHAESVFNCDVAVSAGADLIADFPGSTRTSQRITTEGQIFNV